MSRYPFFDHPLDTRYDWQASDRLGKDHWRVLVPFRLMLSERQWVHVPAGVLSDGGSIPRLVQNMVSPWGKLGQAYVMHDQLCEYLSLTVDGRPVPITRQRCDELLYVAMQVLGGDAGRAGDGESGGRSVPQSGRDYSAKQHRAEAIAGSRLAGVTVAAPVPSDEMSEEEPASPIGRAG